IWLTSNSPHFWRTALCSAVMPAGYWTGISNPAKGTILAPRATWMSWNGVCFRDMIDGRGRMADGRTADGGPSEMDRRRGTRNMPRWQCAWEGPGFARPDTHASVRRIDDSIRLDSKAEIRG